MIYAGHDPMRVMTWPIWVWKQLALYWPAMEASAQEQAVIASIAPHLKRHAYSELMASLERSTAVMDPPTPPAPRIPVERYDPEAAKLWFEAQGIKVISSG